ncbi:hypothetical protein ES705_08238 [subsurface metagenome]
MLDFTLFIFHKSYLVIYLLEIDLVNLITNLSKASINTFS